MCYSKLLFQELFNRIILFNNLNRYIYITHTHTDLNLHQTALLVIKSFNPHNEPMDKYYYYSHFSSEEIKSPERLINGLKVTQLTSKVAWTGAHVVPMKTWAPNLPPDAASGQSMATSHSLCSVRVKSSQDCTLFIFCSCFPPCLGCLPPSALLK